MSKPNDLDAQLAEKLSSQHKNREVKSKRQYVSKRGRPKIYEGVELKSLSFKIPAELKTKLDVYCAKHQVSHRELLVELLEERLDD